MNHPLPSPTSYSLIITRTTPSTQHCSPMPASTTTGPSTRVTSGTVALPRGSSSRLPSDGPAEDPFATDPTALHANRKRVLQLATLIVPGHGAPFTPNEKTPR